MKKETMELLDIIFSDGLYELDLASGNIYNKNTGELKSYYTSKSGFVKVGLSVPNSQYIDSKGRTKNRCRDFIVSNIIAYYYGMFDDIPLDEVHNYLVCYKDNDKLNYVRENLYLEHKSKFSKRLYKETITYNFTEKDRTKANKKRLGKFKQNRKYPKKLLEQFKKDYKDGKKIKDILKENNNIIPRSTLSDILRGVIYKDIKPASETTEETNVLKEIYLKIKEKAEKVDTNIVWTPESKETYDMLIGMQNEGFLSMYPFVYNGRCKQLLILKL